MFNLRNASTYKSDVRQIAREWFAKQGKNPQERTVDAKAEEIRKEKTIPTPPKREIFPV